MLEIKNVYRTYKPKKGVPVKALDGVSLSFADTGLVFILGKSGSGKSTLLNVIGGLDTADSGEFSIKGKSSKDFSQADFDSYRNTFIGFIFQEYNILNEFTVGQNIALAMKLQGKKVDDASLNAILEEVDLVGYGNRKPNELSGGQKQRVAIARALIKEPEIIMADEPTGALDSNTGKQVFDTLKKLSKSKLVIVVSHDREFAEYYGDRVIELADGKIISDITKETAESRKESEGLSVVDDKILHIRKGYKLTKADMAKIQEYLDNADSDTIISLDERSNESFCQIARIDKDGNQEVFRDTDNEVLSEENKKYDGTSKFIRSKLPFSHAFKIGSSSLKTKPFRLFMTIFLCLISFAMFGLADTIGSYNARKTTVNSIIDSKYDSAVYTVQPKNENGYYSDSSGASAKDLGRIKEVTGMDFMGVAYAKSSFSVYDSSKLSSGYYSYYISQINGYLPAGDDNFQKYGFTDMYGRQPIASDEIVITMYTYEHFARGGLTYYDEEEREQVTIKASEFDSPDKFLSLEPTLALNDYNSGNQNYWKIVGIVDTKTNADGRFNSMKPSDNDNSSSSNSEGIGSYLLTSEYQKYINYGYHSLGYVSDNAYNSIINGKISSTTSNGVGAKARGYFYFELNNNSRSVSFDASAKSDDLSKFEIMWFGDAKNSLADNEYIISIDAARDYRLFDYINGEKVDEEEIGAYSISFNKEYFGGLVNVNINQLSDLYTHSSVNVFVSFYEAADALTSEQAEKFRFYVKGIGEVSNNSIMNRYIRDMLSQAHYANYYEQFSLNLGNIEEKSIDEMTVNELKYLYAGYLYTYDYAYEVDDDTLEIKGGATYNAIGLDCGNVVRDYYGKKVYYSELFKVVSYSPFEMKDVRYYFQDGPSYWNNEDGKIVGVYVNKRTVGKDGYLSYNNDETFIINNVLCARAESIEPTVYSFFIAQMPKDRSSIEKLVEIHYDESGDRVFKMQNGVTYLLGMVNSILEVLGQVFLYVGIGLAVFSMLLLSNYIAVSISYKKREIGILRAVGAKSSDVFSIFFSESLVIALINFVLAMVVCGVGCMLINSMLRSEYGLQITLLNFGFRQIALMLLISVAVAIVSSFLPVYRLSRKKPIETIRTA